MEKIKNILSWVLGLVIALFVFYWFVKFCVFFGVLTGTGMWGTSILFVIGCFVFGYLGDWKESD